MSYALSRTPLDPEADCVHVAGDWWYAPWYLNDDGSRSKHLGKYYYDHNAHRPPIVVVLPGGSEFCIDMVASAELETGGAGWRVAGSPEDGTLTVSPSIKVFLGEQRAPWHYHGWLGVQGTPPGHLSDDLDGNAAVHAAWNAERLTRRPIV